ncbi:MAG TPA: caspase family protein [Methylomirabilota bacterium]|jgi:hypothetical protein
MGWRLLSLALVIAVVASGGLLPLGHGASAQAPKETAPSVGSASKADEFLMVDCLLPGQVRRLGRQLQYLTPRRAMKTSARDCQIRGGEYVEFDRATYATALKVWLTLAGEGDSAAQTYVGEIYEKGLGTAPDYAEAARWYRKAADAGFPRAAVNLGSLYEQGLGVPRDPKEALTWYRKAAGSSDTRLEIAPTAPAAAPRPEPSPAPAEIGPVIQLIEPELVATKDANVRAVPVQAPIDRVVMLGRVLARDGVKTFTVNGREETVNSESLFRAELKLPVPDQRVRLEAVDGGQRKSTLEFLVLERPAPARDVVRTGTTKKTFGVYHALVVGNDDYRVLPRLTNSVNDAREVARILRDDYGFNATVLVNGSRYDILAAFNDLRQRLTESDNLLVYYAGHTGTDRTSQSGHWMPVDADPATPGSWIPNAAITDILNAMAVRQVLVVADEWPAATLPRSPIVQVAAGLPEPERMGAVQTLTQKRSRMVLTSGGGQHAFARSLIEILRANATVLPGQELFRLLRMRYTAGPRVEAMRSPEYAPMKYAGHEAGDFVFVRAAYTH